MAANTVPIYSKQGHIEHTFITTANTAKDGTGSAAIIFTAGDNGSRIERVRALARGTNVATVLRIFINNGSDPEVAANNGQFCNVTLAATTLSEVAGLTQVEIPGTDTTAFPLVLPAGYRLLATLGTTIAAGVDVTAVGGDY